MKSVLVTGSSGFIGQTLVRSLDSKQYRIIECPSSQIVNLCNIEEIDALPKADVIIHLAAKSYIPESFINPVSFYSNNLLSTLNILDKAKRDGSKVIFLSTYVYGNPEYLPIDESHPINPLNPYTQSKIICEELCRAYYRDFSVPSVVLRLFNVYGPGQGPSFIIPSILAQLEKPIIELKDSRPRRDFVYIDDVISAIIASTEYVSIGFDIFNVGSGKSVSIKEVANIIKSLTGTKAVIRFNEQTRKGEVLDTVADIRKINSVLNWKAEVSIEDGLKRLIFADSVN
jgi:nucleoside-diphosphate-sugar epimerase